jgi:hypothetical protein
MVDDLDDCHTVGKEAKRLGYACQVNIPDNYDFTGIPIKYGEEGNLVVAEGEAFFEDLKASNIPFKKVSIFFGGKSPTNFSINVSRYVELFPKTKRHHKDAVLLKLKWDIN